MADPSLSSGLRHSCSYYIISSLWCYFMKFVLLLTGFILFQLAEIVNQGKLVSDEIILNLLSKRLESGEAKGEAGFILDGFPRTVRQAVSIHLIFLHKIYLCSGYLHKPYILRLKCYALLICEKITSL